MDADAAVDGDAVHDLGESPTIEYSTFHGNFASGLGGGLFMRSQTSLSHCVFWNNSDSSGLTESAQIHVSAGAAGLNWSCVEGLSGALGGVGNIGDDPLLVNPAVGQYSLSENSPCIDTGDPAQSPQGTDRDGNARYLDGDLDRSMRVDMGAFEFTHVRLTISGDATPGGNLVIESAGTPQLVAILLIGSGSGETLLRPFGPLLFDTTLPWTMIVFAILPDTTTVPVPVGFSPAVPLVVQELAINVFTRAGNTSNAVQVIIE